MSADSDYERQGRKGLQWSVTMALLVVNALVFVTEFHLLPSTTLRIRFQDAFALSLEGLRQGHVWQLLTYQFMHGSLLHIFANSWAIYVFGPVIESALGKGRMLGVYFLSGVVGGLLQVLSFLILPSHFGNEGVVGASAGAFGLVASFAVLFPRQRLVMLLFFVIPLAMRARSLLWFSAAFAIFGIIIPFGNIGHAAHLGGIVTGYLFTRWLMRGYTLIRAADLEPRASLKINPVSE